MRHPCYRLRHQLQPAPLRELSLPQEGMASKIMVGSRAAAWAAQWRYDFSEGEGNMALIDALFRTVRAGGRPVAVEARH